MATEKSVDVGANIEGEAPDVEPTVETDEATYTEDAELERTLGLSGGLAIGVGTMMLRVAGDEGAITLADAADRLEGQGIAVETITAEARAPLEALLEAVPDHDAIVMGEQAPSLGSFLFGEVTERVAAESVGPVLVVRRDEDLEG